jgi:hypothetical protein
MTSSKGTEKNQLTGLMDSYATFFKHRGNTVKADHILDHK